MYSIGHCIIPLIGNLYLERGDSHLAHAAFRDSIRLRERHKESWLNLCLSLHNSGRTEEAEIALEQAIALFPSEEQFLFAKANLMGKLGRYGEGEALYKQAILMRPDKANYHGNLGTTVG